MPGAPGASGGGSATCRRPQPHSTSCRSYCTVAAAASGRSVTWWSTGRRGRRRRTGPRRTRSPGWEHIAGAVRVLVRFQVRARRAALLAGPAAAAAPGLRRRRCFPGQIIGTRRHPGVARVPGQEPLNAGEPLLQVRDLRVLVLQQHPQPLVRLPQPPVLCPQRGNLIRHTGGIGLIGHTWTTSEPTHRE